MNTAAFLIDIAEPLNEDSLDRLCRSLGLEGGGRLDDDWDYEFGTRAVKGAGVASTAFTLWRGDDEPWHVEVAHPKSETPTAEELAGWRKEIIDGVKAAGLTPVPSE